MSLAARFVPLPRPERLLTRRSDFVLAYSRTLNLLERELKMLGAQNIVIQAGFRANQIRNDGWPYSGARPEHPAVVISFRSRTKNQDLAFPCSRFDRYEDNVRAIALSLEALRAVDRYGVTQRAEQYTGWAQLPPADPATAAAAAVAAVERAAADIIRLAGEPGEATILTLLRDEAAVYALYRTAARRCHPDATGGKREDWDVLQAAKDRLDAHHAGRGVKGGV